MIQRCDDAIKAGWLSQLFYELVLIRGYSRLFMRAEKTLSALSVMDVQAFLNIPSEHYNRIGEEECEPFLGSGLYQSPKIDGTVVDGLLDMGSKHCEITEIGYCIYNVLNGLSVTEVEQNELL